MRKRLQSALNYTTSKAMTMVWVGLCYQTFAASEAIAEPKSSPDRKSPFERRSSARIGVSVTVLPTCAIRVNGEAVPIGQPVEILCTNNTRYGVDLTEGSGTLAAVGSDGVNKPSQGPITMVSNGRANTFLLQRATVQEQKIAAGDTEVSVLSIDF